MALQNQNKGGRPRKIDEAVLRKLEEAFGLGSTDAEACFYADIAPSTLYAYEKENPEFSERKKALKERPILLARRTVVNALETDYNHALRYLERKKRDEFSLRSELTGKDGKPLERPSSEWLKEIALACLQTDRLKERECE